MHKKRKIIILHSLEKFGVVTKYWNSASFHLQTDFRDVTLSLAVEATLLAGTLAISVEEVVGTIDILTLKK